MPSRNHLAVALSLLLLFVTATVQAQDKQLSDAQTFAAISAYIQQEIQKFPARPTGIALANILIPASDRLLEIAKTDVEKRNAYNWRIRAFQEQVRANVEGTPQKFEAYLAELATNEDPVVKQNVTAAQFYLFAEKAKAAEATPENFAQFKTELKSWCNRKDFSITDTAELGFTIAKRNNVPEEQLIKELVAYIWSFRCSLPLADKEKRVVRLEGMVRLQVGNDPNLYGKTLDNEDFDWESLRGKYVLIQFTATWCKPCQKQIPGMLATYKKYKDKGFEIVSVYLWQDARGDTDPVGSVKKYAAEKELPWIILSEPLSKRANQPEYGDFYNIKAVPALVLVDKEGKIIMSNPNNDQWNVGDLWKAKLAEIFK